MVNLVPSDHRFLAKNFVLGSLEYRTLLYGLFRSLFYSPRSAAFVPQFTLTLPPSHILAASYCVYSRYSLLPE